MSNPKAETAKRDAKAAKVFERAEKQFRSDEWEDESGSRLSQTPTETKHYSDGSSATGTPPLPCRSPAQQDIRDALLAAKGFVKWSAGAEAQRRVETLIERALNHV